MIDLKQIKAGKYTVPLIHESPLAVSAALARTVFGLLHFSHLSKFLVPKNTINVKQAMRG